MYLTSQRVYSASRKKAGINTFLYRHGDQEFPGMRWDRPRLERVADERVGTRAAEHVEIGPGGNRVLSYVDIVAADSTPIAEVEEALRVFGETFSPDALPETRLLGSIAVRFGAEFGLMDHVREEFAMIAEPALNLLRHPTEPVWRTAQPLEVDVEHLQEGGLRFTLREDTKRRLAAIHGPDWQAPRFSIAYDVRDAFEQAHGDIFRNSVLILTSLEFERVAELGGMRFYDVTTGNVLAEWPQR
jgi:hypothetical protein